MFQKTDMHGPNGGHHWVSRQTWARRMSIVQTKWRAALGDRGYMARMPPLLPHTHTNFARNGGRIGVSLTSHVRVKSHLGANYTRASTTTQTSMQTIF
jgi:hypothetical protein